MREGAKVGEDELWYRETDRDIDRDRDRDRDRGSPNL